MKLSQVNPLAIQVVKEIGVELGVQRSKHLNEYLGQPFDYVITVCGSATESCPVFPGCVQRLHWSFPGPASVEGDEDEKLVRFRQVRDDIQAALEKWLAAGKVPANNAIT